MGCVAIMHQIFLLFCTLSIRRLYGLIFAPIIIWKNYKYWLKGGMIPPKMVVFNTYTPILR